VARVVSWNIGGGTAGWPDVLDLDADVALLPMLRAAHIGRDRGHGLARQHPPDRLAS
jgi:hypothetical protein